jgi:hypothetical protein
MTILAACFAGLAGTVCGAETDERPVISDAEYARAWVECQNLMSMHNYYHGVNHNLEELDAIWVSEDGPYAETATFSQPFGVWEGIDLIKVFYGNPRTKDPNQSLKEMIKNEPSAYPVGTMGIHLNTTPIIVVAGDGKTAKGIWYSPGPLFSYTGQKDEDGNDLAGGTLFMEKYGVDFVKEDGEWKIWHIQMYYDYVFDMTADLTRPGVRAGGEGPSGPPPSDGDDEEAPPAGPGPQVEPTRPNPVQYEQWSPTRVSTMEPRLPEPYYTFSETFSY